MELIARANFALAIITFLAILINAKYTNVKSNGNIGVKDTKDNHKEKDECPEKVAVPVTYDGWCRSRNGSIDTLILEATDENSLKKCQAKCYDNEECVAFSYETPTHHKKYNCNRYKGGPYTAGSGRPNTKCYILEQGVHLLSGCWKSSKASNFERYLNAMGVSPVLSRNIARNKKGSIGIAFDNKNPQIITIVGRLMPDDAFQAKIAMNFTKVKADNETMYYMPLNMLTGNTDATDVIFAKDDDSLTLYAVRGSAEKDRVFFVQWRVSDNSTYKMTEKWVHIPTETESISFFDRVENPDKDHYCSLLAPVIPFRSAPFPTKC